MSRFGRQQAYIDRLAAALVCRSNEVKDGTSAQPRHLVEEIDVTHGRIDDAGHIGIA